MLCRGRHRWRRWLLEEEGLEGRMSVNAIIRLHVAVWGYTLVWDEAPAMVLHCVGQQQGRRLPIGPSLVRLDSWVNRAGHLLSTQLPSVVSLWLGVKGGKERTHHIIHPHAEKRLDRCSKVERNELDPNSPHTSRRCARHNVTLRFTSSPVVEVWGRGGNIKFIHGGRGRSIWRRGVAQSRKA